MTFNSWFSIRRQMVDITAIMNIQSVQDVSSKSFHVFFDFCFTFLWFIWFCARKRNLYQIWPTRIISKSAILHFVIFRKRCLMISHFRNIQIRFTSGWQVYKHFLDRCWVSVSFDHEKNYKSKGNFRKWILGGNISNLV